MKIAHVITRMNLGGAEENTLLTCQGLARRGHDVTLITGLSTGPEGNLMAHSDMTGIRVIECADIVREISPWHDLCAYRFLKHLFKSEQFDVVHTHASKAGILGRFAAWSCGVPFVTHTVHGQAFHAFQHPLKNALFKKAERMAAKRCHRIYAVAQAMIDQCVEANIAPRDKYQVVYSGMNLDSYINTARNQSLRDELGIAEHAPVVGMIARIFPQKGYEDLPLVAPKIIAAFPDVRFLIMGDGTMRPALESQLKALGILEHFVFTGMVPPDRVCALVPQMDILLHLSFHEGLPRTVVQALAARVPVVAYPVDGTPEVVDDAQNGYLVPLRDATAVAEKAIALLKDPALRVSFGANGQQKILARFDTKTMVDTLEREYIRHLGTTEG